MILENEEIMINKYKKYTDEAKVYYVAKRTPLDYQALLSARLNKINLDGIFFSISVHFYIQFFLIFKV